MGYIFEAQEPPPPRPDRPSRNYDHQLQNQQASTMVRHGSTSSLSRQYDLQSNSIQQHVPRSLSGTHLGASTEHDTTQETSEYYRESRNRNKSLPPRRNTSLSLRSSNRKRRPTASSHYSMKNNNTDDHGLSRDVQHRKSTMRTLRKWIKKYFGISKSAPEGFIERGMSTRQSDQLVTAYPPRPWMPSADNRTPNRSRATSQVVPKSSDFIESTDSKPYATGELSKNNHQSIEHNNNNKVPAAEDDDSGVDSPSTCERLSSALHELPTPCLTGIINHGNTCYINAVLQCLSCTDPFAEYLVSERFLRDLEDQTPAQQMISRQFGTSGAVTNSLAIFFQKLWFNRHDDSYSRRFKTLLGQFSADYRTSSQQDAQEFLVWLLDKVHEDMNTATKRTYKQTAGKIKGSEEDLADLALDHHRRAHCSYVTRLFEGQFRSSVYCPTCRDTKLNFEPYMCVSLPVPQDTKKPLFVTLVFWNRRPRLLKLGLNVEMNARLADVKSCLMLEANIIMCRLLDNGLSCVYSDSTEIVSLDSPHIYAVETTPLGLSNIDRQSSTMMHVDSLIIIFCHAIANGVTVKRCSHPFSLTLSRESSYEDVCRRMLAMSRMIVIDGIQCRDVPLNAFRVRIADEYAAGVYLDGAVTMPLYTQDVERALSYGNGRGVEPVSLRLVLEWDANAINLYLDDREETIVDHQSCAILADQMKVPSATLVQCLYEYTRTETLEEWRCEHCRSRLSNAQKTLKFRSLPDVLVIHLKRFRHLPDGDTVKLDRRVEFSLDSLDMSPFVYQSGTTPLPIRKSNGVYQQNQQRNSNGRSSRRRGSASGSSAVRSDMNGSGALYVNTEHSDNLYDLYAVVNHKGESINSGHYTAYCRNPVDDQWRLFDDTHVELVDAKSVIANCAYLLFYERRGSWKSNCRSSSESGFSEHWFYRLPTTVVNKYIDVSRQSIPSQSRPSRPATPQQSNGVYYDRNETLRQPKIEHQQQRIVPLVVDNKRPVPMPRKSLQKPITTITTINERKEIATCSSIETDL